MKLKCAIFFLRIVQEQVQPDITITSSKQDERLLKILEGEGKESAG